MKVLSARPERIIIEKDPEESLQAFVLTTRRTVRRYQARGGQAMIKIMQPETVYKAYWPGLHYIMTKMAATKQHVFFAHITDERMKAPR